jgi:hypothetical protein
MRFEDGKTSASVEQQYWYFRDLRKFNWLWLVKKEEKEELVYIGNIW